MKYIPGYIPAHVVTSWYLYNNDEKVSNLIEFAKERFKSAMAPLFDSSGLPNVSDVRKQELKASSASQYPWFERAYNELGTIESRYRDRYYGIYRSSFSKHRSRFDELGRVSLANNKR